MRDEREFTENEIEETKTEADAAQLLQDKHDAAMKTIDDLVENYGVNILVAINYVNENKTAIEYRGQENELIKLGLRKALSN